MNQADGKHSAPVEQPRVDGGRRPPVRSVCAGPKGQGGPYPSRASDQTALGRGAVGAAGLDRRDGLQWASAGELNRTSAHPWRHRGLSGVVVVDSTGQVAASARRSTAYRTLRRLSLHARVWTLCFGAPGGRRTRASPGTRQPVLQRQDVTGRRDMEGCPVSSRTACSAAAPSFSACPGNGRGTEDAPPARPRGLRRGMPSAVEEELRRLVVEDDHA